MAAALYHMTIFLLSKLCGGDMTHRTITPPGLPKNLAVK